MHEKVQEKPKFPYRYLPFPHFFFWSGWLEPKKKNYGVRSLFLLWAFRNIYQKGHPTTFKNHTIWLDPFEMICSRRDNGSGLSENQFRDQIKSLIDAGYLVENVHKSVKTVFSVYKWQIDLFSIPENGDPSQNDANTTELDTCNDENENGDPRNAPKDPSFHPSKSFLYGQVSFSSRRTISPKTAAPLHSSRQSIAMSLPRNLFDHLIKI